MTPVLHVGMLQQNPCLMLRGFMFLQEPNVLCPVKPIELADCPHSAAQTHPAVIIAPLLSKVHIYRLFGLADDDICHWEPEEWRLMQILRGENDQKMHQFQQRSN